MSDPTSRPLNPATGKLERAAPSIPFRRVTLDRIHYLDLLDPDFIGTRAFLNLVNSDPVKAADYIVKSLKWLSVELKRGQGDLTQANMRKALETLRKVGALATLLSGSADLRIAHTQYVQEIKPDLERSILGRAAPSLRASP